MAVKKEDKRFLMNKKLKKINRMLGKTVRSVLTVIILSRTWSLIHLNNFTTGATKSLISWMIDGQIWKKKIKISKFNKKKWRRKTNTILMRNRKRLISSKKSTQETSMFTRRCRNEKLTSTVCSGITSRFWFMKLVQRLKVCC